MRKINRAIKIRIYPDTNQRIQIEKTIGCSRFIYNCMLADKVEYYTKEKKMLEVENKKASFETIYSKDIIKYTINIISKNGKCKNDIARSITVTLPVINNYSKYKECEEKKNKNYKYCKEEIYESLPSIEEFYKGVK